MTLYLGIDGGGAGCRAALADRAGRVLCHGDSGPANINANVEGAARGIVAAAMQALARSPTGDAPPVVSAGGLSPQYCVRLADTWPQRPARGGSVDGPAAMAMQTDSPT